MKKEKILSIVTDYYLSQGEKYGNFNGYLFSNFEEYDSQNLIDSIIELIRKREIDIIFGDNHPNPNIKAFHEEDISVQIKKIKNIKLEPSKTETLKIEGGGEIKIKHPGNKFCLYPSKEHLKTVVTPDNFNNKPYTLKLAYGEPELDFVSFDMSILEYYRNDPRYNYNNTNINGYIFLNEENKTNIKKESDNIFLESFGFSFDNKTNYRYVAVFNIYLSKLSAEHQSIWKAKEIYGLGLNSNDCFLHPVYGKNTCGYFTDEVIIFTAILDEIYHINKMTQLINGYNLFKKDFFKNTPKEFGFLIRPTKKEYYSFIHTLDKILSENLNKDFFKEEGLDLKIEREIKPGKVEIINKGTVQLLKDYFTKIKFYDNEPVKELLKKINKIRKLRQKPGHLIIDDKFDHKFLEDQKIIINDAYYIVRFIRLIFTNHPKVKGYKIPDYLYTGENIIDY